MTEKPVTTTGKSINTVSLQQQLRPVGERLGFLYMCDILCASWSTCACASMRGRVQRAREAKIRELVMVTKKCVAL